MRAPRTLALGALALLLACGGHEPGEHAHGDDDHDERPSAVITAWSTRHELFAELPALVVDQPSEITAHLTALDGHVPVTAGPVTLTVIGADGGRTAVTADAPIRPGIFVAALTPTAAGRCQLEVALDGDLVTSSACEVYAAGAPIPPAAAALPGLVTYLKESSWGTGLATTVVAARPLTPILRVTGELRAVPSHEARLTAPTAGRVQLPATPLVLGAEAVSGQLVATIVPPAGVDSGRGSLAATLRAARAEAAAAATEVARLERLRSSETVAQRQVDEARARAAIATAGVDAAADQLARFDASARGRGGAGLAVRAPRGGTVVALDVVDGEGVDAGASLARVVDLGRLWLHADVYEADLAQVTGATRARFQVDAEAEPIVIAPPSGQVVLLGNVVDERTRTVPMIFEFDNPGGRLRLGSRATVFIETGPPREVTAIPTTAIVRDAGRAIVFVQVTGEQFARRPIELGQRDGAWVEVTAGLALGERVVTTGAYDVKLASAGAAVPEHGHAH
ncbi:MAG: efflux RND transporter periplasmic adaptor subunit [Kofleriaceae bacterium]